MEYEHDWEALGLLALSMLRSGQPADGCSFITALRAGKQPTDVELAQLMSDNSPLKDEDIKKYIDGRSMQAASGSPER